MVDRFILLVLAASAATVASAAPRESVTFLEVDSIGLGGNPANQVRTAAFAGSDGGGAYTAKYLTVSGLLTDWFGTGSWAREAVIEITPPGGAPFVCAPFNIPDYFNTLTVEPGRHVVPIGQFQTEGEWTFRFAETYDDDPGGADQTWDSITFTLEDAPPPLMATPTGGVESVYAGVPSDGVQGAGSTVLARTCTDVGNVNKLQIVGRLTTNRLVTVDNTYNVPNQARLRITPPVLSGLEPFDVNPGAGGISTALINLTIDLPGAPSTGVPVTGVWIFEFYETTDEPGVVDAVWQHVSITLQSTNPPTAVGMREITDGGSSVTESDFVTAVVNPLPGTVQWLTFVTSREASPTAGGAIDIDMVGTSALPENDFSLGLYSAAGQRIAYSHSTGPGMLPQISVGPGTRTRNGDGLPYDGQNALLSPGGTTTANTWPAAPAGTCYLAVCSGDDGAVFGGSLWSVEPSTEANGPAATVRVRFYRNTPAMVPAAAATLNLGTLSGSLNGAVSLPSDPGARFKWIKFTVPTAAEDATGRYIDIDTANTLSPLNDTNIALYNNAGVLVASNDDAAPGWDAGNPTGGNSVLSFGTTLVTRNYVPLNANLPVGNGRNGPLSPGVYYLQISECCAGYGANRFWVLNDYVTHTEPGTVFWNIHNNYGQACGASDIAQQGGIPGTDNRLDNNDFILYIELYFNQAVSADVGAAGGLPGQDGLFDNNDFIVFIDHYFTAPASCR